MRSVRRDLHDDVHLPLAQPVLRRLEISGHVEHVDAFAELGLQRRLLGDKRRVVGDDQDAAQLGQQAGVADAEQQQDEKRPQQQRQQQARLPPDLAHLFGDEPVDANQALD